MAQKRECSSAIFKINQFENFQLVGLASSAFGVYYILDKERVQMHQVILVNLQDIKGQAHDIFSRIFQIRIHEFFLPNIMSFDFLKCFYLFQLKNIG